MEISSSTLIYFCRIFWISVGRQVHQRNPPDNSSCILSTFHSYFHQIYLDGSKETEHRFILMYPRCTFRHILSLFGSHKFIWSMHDRLIGTRAMRLFRCRFYCVQFMCRSCPRNTLGDVSAFAWSPRQTSIYVVYHDIYKAFTWPDQPRLCLALLYAVRTQLNMDKILVSY